MKVQINDTFIDSLKRMNRHQTWWYKTYSTFRYDIPHFIGNVWRFRKELYTHQWWDYRFTLNMLERSLTIMERGMSEKGMEVSETREPKVRAMRRALELLRNNKEDNYIQRSEMVLGLLSNWDLEIDENGFMVDNDTLEQKQHNKSIYKMARELENEEWKELWDIFKGSKNSKKYGPEYDGSDMRSWWD